MNYVDAIIEFNNDPNVRKLREFYSSKSFPEILGVSRRELSHSAFLAWLFSSAESHMFGIQPVMQLLELYVKNALEQQRIGSDAAQKLLNPILTRQIDLLSSSVATEEYVEIAKKKGRADIVISCDMRIGKENSVNKLRIVVENKVYSTEHDNQTEIYYEYYSKCRKSGEFTLYISLSVVAPDES